MSQSIWKFPLPHAVTTLTMSVGAHVLTVQMQGETATLWALCTPEAATEERRFAIFGTGWNLPDEPGRYVGTVQDGELVWHVFEEPQQ